MKNTMLFLFLSALLGANNLANASPAPTQPNINFNPAQTQAIENIIHHYLITHPQVLIEAANALQNQQQAQWQKTAHQEVPKLAQALFANPESPTVGNLQGNITLVEFFDYQCPHCKEMASQIDNLLKTYPQLRVVFKVLPIFGENSEFAAKAAMASRQQSLQKFIVFHNLMLQTHDRLVPTKVLILATQAGLNIKELQKDMQNMAIADEIKNNDQLARQLQLTGTPGFIIAHVKIIQGKTQSVKNPIFIPGAVMNGVLAQAVAEVIHGNS